MFGVNKKYDGNEQKVGLLALRKGAPFNELDINKLRNHLFNRDFDYFMNSPFKR